MALLRIIALLPLIGLGHSIAPHCSYWKLWNYLNLTTTNSFVANVRPVKSWTTVTTVEIEMILFGILKVDEKDQTVQGHIWTTTHWDNEFLKWDPEDFCGIDVITVPRSLLWIPDIHIEEDASDSGSTSYSPYVNLYPDGWATATSRQVLTFTCQLELLLFPFDDQKCILTFASMTANAQAIVLASRRNGTQLTNSSKNVIITRGEWDLINLSNKASFMTNKDNDTSSALKYLVTIRRRPMLYVIIFIVPLFYFLVLDVASFFISEARGEKLSFKITILLSISVLLLILKDMLPSTEKMMPWIANYCIGIFALVGLSVFEAMVLVFLLGFEETVQKAPQRCVNCEDEIQLERTNSKEPLVLTVAGEVTKGSPPPVSASAECRMLRKILHEIKWAREELERSEEPRTRPRFKTLVLIIDHLFFMLYFVTVCTFFIYMYCVWGKRFFNS